MENRPFQLMTVTVGDAPEGWAQAGFTMTGTATRIGSTGFVCDPSAGHGIVSVQVDGVSDEVDGLPFVVADATPTKEVSSDHPNRVVDFDHIVVMSPAIDRTADALIAAGIERRRTRRFQVGGEARRQDFFWLGDVILELVGLDGVDEPGPARFWGLALECDDLDGAADALGDGLGRIKDAVQPGRRIATVRTKDLGVSVPIALMSPHPRD